MNRSILITGVSLLVAGASLFAFVAPGLTQGGGEDESAKAAEAMKKAVDEGNRLFRDPALGTSGKSCASCHEDPEKPKLALAARIGDYPKWDRREGAVITLGQKLRQMVEKNVKGTAPELGSATLVAIESYLMTLRAAR